MAGRPGAKGDGKRGDGAEAALLEVPVARALLRALEAHALVLDLDLRVQAYDPGLPAALGAPEGEGGPDLVPLLARIQVGAQVGVQGWGLAGPPVPLGHGGLHLWAFRDLRRQAFREELEMRFLHTLLASLVRDWPGGPGLDRLWARAQDLYRSHVAAVLASGPAREAPGARDQENEDPAPGTESAPGGDAGPRPRVLVVDDSPMVRRLLAILLGRDYEVSLAADGEEALAAAREGPPDLVLLDLVMPGLDGFQVCAALKADPLTQGVPVLVLTALEGEAEEVRALEAGAIDFIQKPIVPATVLARVRNHVALKAAQDRLQRQAAQDGLTGLANRALFERVLDQEWQRARREGRPLSVVLADVDCFKAYNDAYGHPQGDACLREVAGALRRALRRPADLAARYGGEEFVCILPETDAAGAAAIARSLAGAVAALGIPHAHSEAGTLVTVSVGAATAVPAGEGGPEALLVQADRAMYAAKRRTKQGRRAGRA